MKFKRKQKDVLTELAEQKERLKLAKVEAFRAKKIVMNRLGKTVELIVKLENNLNDEGKDDQKVKIRDQLETRGLEAARDHELLEIEGTPQDIVDFRRMIVPKLILHACPSCKEEMDPRTSRNPDDSENWSFMPSCKMAAGLISTPMQDQGTQFHLSLHHRISLQSMNWLRLN